MSKNYEGATGHALFGPWISDRRPGLAWRAWLAGALARMRASGRPRRVSVSRLGDDWLRRHERDAAKHGDGT